MTAVAGGRPRFFAGSLVTGVEGVLGVDSGPGAGVAGPVWIMQTSDNKEQINWNSYCFKNLKRLFKYKCETALMQGKLIEDGEIWHYNTCLILNIIKLFTI